MSEESMTIHEMGNFLDEQVLKNIGEAILEAIGDVKGSQIKEMAEEECGMAVSLGKCDKIAEETKEG